MRSRQVLVSLGVSLPLVAGLLVGPVAALSASGATGAPAVAVSVTTTPWYGGGTTKVTVTNRTSAAIAGWQVSFPWNGRPDSVWSATPVAGANGSLAVRNAAWNGSIAVGASVSYGFTSYFTGAVPTPTRCTAVSGAKTVDCVVVSGSAPAPKPTPSVTPTASPSTTPTVAPTTSPSVTPTVKPSPTATGTPTVTPTVKPTPTVAPSPPALNSSTVFAPYIDMASWPVPNLSAFRKSSGVLNYSLGFITAASPCVPAWGGYTALATSASGEQINAINSSISTLVAGGGSVIVSFGGAYGTELAQTCRDVPSLAAAYRSVIDKYKVTRIDLDIEGGAQGDRAANVRRAQALASVQKSLAAAGRTLNVQLTLPVMPYGLTRDGLGVLTDSVSGGLRVDVVNIMTMNYGIPLRTMGQAAIDAATSTARQLADVFPTLTAAQRLSLVGVTPMIGVNDVSPEVFWVSDAVALNTWARANKLGLISFWEIRRDGPCPNNAAVLSTTCSGTRSPAWAFARALGG